MQKSTRELVYVRDFGWICVVKTIHMSAYHPMDDVDYYIQLRDTNSDGWVKNSDGEVWCSSDFDGNNHILCTFESISVATGDCTENEGVWQDNGEGNYTCNFGPDNWAILLNDADGDGYFQPTDYHCEETDSSGNPNGTRIWCWFDELVLPQE